MSSEYDYETTFTFRKTNKFWVELNKQMVIKDRDTLNYGDNGLYHLVLFSSLPSNFNNCINDDGTLKTSDLPSGMTRITTGYTDTFFHLGVEWLDDGENGFNLFLDEWDENDDPVDVNIPIADETVLLVKGIALCKKKGDRTNVNDYVVAYARPSTPFRVENYITLNYDSSFVGHSSCKEA